VITVIITGREHATAAVKIMEACVFYKKKIYHRNECEYRLHIQCYGLKTHRFQTVLWYIFRTKDIYLVTVLLKCSYQHSLRNNSEEHSSL